MTHSTFGNHPEHIDVKEPWPQAFHTEMCKFSYSNSSLNKLSSIWFKKKPEKYAFFLSQRTCARFRISNLFQFLVKILNSTFEKKMQCFGAKEKIQEWQTGDSVSFPAFCFVFAEKLRNFPLPLFSRLPRKMWLWKKSGTTSLKKELRMFQQKFEFCFLMHPEPQERRSCASCIRAALWFVFWKFFLQAKKSKNCG